MNSKNIPTGYTEVPALSSKASTWAGTQVFVAKRNGILHLLDSSGREHGTLSNNFNENYGALRGFKRRESPKEIAEFIKDQNERSEKENRRKSQDFLQNDVKDFGLFHAKGRVSIVCPGFPGKEDKGKK